MTQLSELSLEWVTATAYSCFFLISLVWIIIISHANSSCQYLSAVLPVENYIFKSCINPLQVNCSQTNGACYFTIINTTRPAFIFNKKKQNGVFCCFFTRTTKITAPLQEQNSFAQTSTLVLHYQHFPTTCLKFPYWCKCLFFVYQIMVTCLLNSCDSFFVQYLLNLFTIASSSEFGTFCDSVPNIRLKSRIWFVFPKIAVAIYESEIATLFKHVWGICRKLINIW